jgi:hypothetical protein
MPRVDSPLRPIMHFSLKNTRIGLLLIKARYEICPAQGEIENRKKIFRRQQGSNLRGRSPTDFKSVSLTTRTYRLLDIFVFFLIIHYESLFQIHRI